jgi:thiol-disulfide isomerase/thioredoxin
MLTPSSVGQPAMTVMSGRRMPTLDGTTRWINSAPLRRVDLGGRVVLVNFWTLTCINWLRTVPYLREWSRVYRDDGLLVVGVHTPEFGFERDTDLVAQATQDRALDYPVAVDNDYAVWNAFDNHYWPAVYLVDAAGLLRGQYFGEGNHEPIERSLQRLLGVRHPLVTATGTGVEQDADWAHLRSPETYLGSSRTINFASANGAALEARQHFRLPEALALNHWGLGGDWTITHEFAALHQPGGSLAFRFHARDVHLVLSTVAAVATPFRVLLDGLAPGAARGMDLDEQGYGVLREGRMYQLVRTRDVHEHHVEVIFSRPGVRAYVFTFG